MIKDILKISFYLAAKFTEVQFRYFIKTKKFKEQHRQEKEL